MEAPIEILHQNTLLSKFKGEILVIVTEGGAEERESPYTRTSIFHFDREAERIGNDTIVNCRIVDLNGTEREKSYLTDQELINAFGGFIGKYIWGEIINTQPQDKE